MDVSVSSPRDELLKACEAGDITVVKRIVEDSSNESARLFEALPTTPLHGAALHGHLEIVQYLVGERACDIKCGDDFGSTPFLHAALSGNLEIVEYLYSKGGSDLMYPPDAMGRTALHVACMDDRLAVVKFLIDIGADPSRCDDNGITPLHMAAGGGALSVVKYLTEEKGCDPENMNKNCNTPLYIAALCNQLEVLQYLTFKWGCNPECTNHYGKTPLHGASQNGHLDVVQSLVEDHNVSPTCRDNDGNTPLHVACLFGHLPIMKYLIEDRLCDPETKNLAGVTLEKMVNEKGYIYHDVTAYIRSVTSILAATMCGAVVKDLVPFTVTAHTTGRELGRGSFGKVVELNSNGETFAGKVFNIDVRSANRRSILKKVVEEIMRVLQIQHDNIVQSKTVCFLSGNPLPVLMMERMMSDLQAFVLSPHNADLTLQKKLRILCDVACGLDYLHNRQPAIVHRDLTARNVLLTAHVCAKIGDFGNARVMDLDPDANVYTLTTCPGTAEYMPPEAQGHNQQNKMAYGPSLDVFSFGHLSLFVLTQLNVKVLPPKIFDACNEIVALSEVKRRSESFERVNAILTGFQPLLVLIKKCLHDLADQRPATDHLLGHLRRLVVEMMADDQEGVVGRDGEEGAVGRDGEEDVVGRDGEEGVVGRDAEVGVVERDVEEDVVGSDAEEDVVERDGIQRDHPIQARAERGDDRPTMNPLCTIQSEGVGEQGENEQGEVPAHNPDEHRPLFGGNLSSKQFLQFGLVAAGVVVLLGIILASASQDPAVNSSWLDKEPEMKLLHLIKYTDAAGESRTFHLIMKIQNDCRRLGTLLGIDNAILNGIDNRLTPEEKCEKILDQWMMRGDSREYKVSWAGLLQALEDLQLKGVAKHLRLALTRMVVK